MQCYPWHMQYYPLYKKHYSLCSHSTITRWAYLSFIVAVLLFHAVLIHILAFPESCFLAHLQLLVFILSAWSWDHVHLQWILILYFALQVFVPIGLDPSPDPVWPCSLVEGRWFPWQWVFVALSWTSVHKLNIRHEWDSTQYCLQACQCTNVKTVSIMRVKLRNMISIMSTVAHSSFTDK